MLKELITLDQELLLALNGSDSLFMDGLMWTFTQTLTWVPLLVGIIYVLFQNQRPSVCFTIILTAILLVVFTDQFSSSLCKPYFHRLRPTRTPEIAAMVDVVNGYRGGTKHLWQMEKRVQYDVWYITNCNIFLDIKIIFMTALNGFRGDKNAY